MTRPEPTFEARHTPERATRALRADVANGLTAQPKWLPPTWFYDARGSELFERITRLAEYYPARAEREILADAAGELARITGTRSLIELGSGSSEKTRLLLEAFSNAGTLAEFVPFDVSEQALRSAADAIAGEFPTLAVHGVIDDFTSQLDLPISTRPRLVAFLGGTIGNFLPDERAKFLTSVRNALEDGEWLLLGTDLIKDRQTLVRAYDDAAGVTAEFNRNILHVLNTELGADFDPAAFTHRAVWNEEQEWIEMRLRARRPMHVALPAVDLEITFVEGEELRTEVSAKFHRDRVISELDAAGFELERWYTDDSSRFAVSLARAVS